MQRVVVEPHGLQNMRMRLETFAHRRADLRVIHSEQIHLRLGVAALPLHRAQHDRVELARKIMLDDQLADVVQQPGEIFHARHIAESARDFLGQPRHEHAVEPETVPVNFHPQMRKGVHHADGQGDAADFPHADHEQRLVDGADVAPAISQAAGHAHAARCQSGVEGNHLAEIVERQSVVLHHRGQLHGDGGEGRNHRFVVHQLDQPVTHPLFRRVGADKIPVVTDAFFGHRFWRQAKSPNHLVEFIG